MPAAEVICHKEGAAGVITLNRPHALNALTHAMVRAISAALDAWESDGRILCILIEAAGQKAFCAGGDIRWLHQRLQAGDFQTPLQFWADEYRLNQRIKRYPKPFVALVDGLVMGGGAGVSLNGSHVLAGEKFSFAMPEAGIGFFPDVGATYFLSHLPDQWGAWLALTGSRADAVLARSLGLASAYFSAAGLVKARAQLVAGAGIAEVLASANAPARLPEAPWMAQAFAADDVTGVLRALDAWSGDGSLRAREAAQAIRQKSPTSLAIALRQMRIGRAASFEQALQTEYRIVSRLVHLPDFAEGVRAAVIDKDHQPRWSPAAHADVRGSDIDAIFAPLDKADLFFAPEQTGVHGS